MFQKTRHQNKSWTAQWNGKNSIVDLRGWNIPTLQISQVKIFGWHSGRWRSVNSELRVRCSVDKINQTPSTWKKIVRNVFWKQLCLFTLRIEFTFLFLYSRLMRLDFLLSFGSTLHIMRINDMKPRRQGQVPHVRFRSARLQKLAEEHSTFFRVYPLTGFVKYSKIHLVWYVSKVILKSLLTLIRLSLIILFLKDGPYYFLS